MKFKFMGADAKPKSVNNIAELEKWPWRDFIGRPSHRCLIPLTAFAEAEGSKGGKTRTWFPIKDQPIFAWAGANAAQSAVDKKLYAQETFSLMESVVSQKIACGHVAAAGVPGRGNVDQNFVFQNGRLIMDDDPDFDSSAIAYHLAAGGENSADDSDESNN